MCVCIVLLESTFVWCDFCEFMDYFCFILEYLLIQSELKKIADSVLSRCHYYFINVIVTIINTFSLFYYFIIIFSYYFFLFCIINTLLG